METVRPLFWHQGLFLQPQHFQLADLHTLGLFEPYRKLLLPNFWGVVRVAISPSALSNDSIEVREGEFVFQDGTHVVLPGNAVVESRSFAESWTERGTPAKVYLGVRKWTRSGANVTVVPALDGLASVPTRYVSAAGPEEVADFHHAGQPAEIQHLYFNLKIFLESEISSAGDFQLIPIALLRQDGEKVILAAEFSPPALTIEGSPALLYLVREIRDQLASRCRQLEEYKIQRGVHSAEFGSRDMVFLLALRSLNRYVPLLTHFTETPTLHPWHAFGLLRQLVGELSTFSGAVNVHGEDSSGDSLLKRYEHQDPLQAFASAHNLISRLLDEITAGPEYIFKLEYDGTYFACELPPAVFEGRNRFFLVVETESDSKAVTDALQGIAKLSSRENLPLLIARALPGVALQHLSIPPQELPRRANSLYFQINPDAEQWSKVQQFRNLALYWNAVPSDFKGELMVVGRT